MSVCFTELIFDNHTNSGLLLSLSLATGEYQLVLLSNGDGSTLGSFSFFLLPLHKDRAR